MSTRIRTVSVLGAGTMGAQIAAHFANAGIPVLLLDVTRDAARDGLARARQLKPDPFFTPDGHALVRTGGFEEDLAAIATSDWIIEAVVERLDVKQALFERVDRHRAAHAIVSSNTSGIPIAAIVAGRSPSFRAHALGTHFFNPPRYLRLVEIIRTADTDPAVEKTVAEFCDHRLGKGVVAARDTPNFIANRIGLYGVMQILRTWTESPDGSPAAPHDGFSIAGDRRHHGSGHRPSEERHVPDDGPRWRRRAGVRRLEPGRQPQRGGPSRVRAAAGRERHGQARLGRKQIRARASTRRTRAARS